MDILVDLDMDVLQSDIDFYGTLTSLKGINSIDEYKKMLFNKFLENDEVFGSIGESPISESKTNETCISGCKEKGISDDMIEVVKSILSDSSNFRNENIVNSISESTNLETRKPILDTGENNISYSGTGVVLEDFTGKPSTDCNSDLGNDERKGIEVVNSCSSDDELYDILNNPDFLFAPNENSLHGVILEDYVPNTLDDDSDDVESGATNSVDITKENDDVSGVTKESNDVVSDSLKEEGSASNSSYVKVSTGVILEDFRFVGHENQEGISDSAEKSKDSVSNGVILEDLVIPSVNMSKDSGSISNIVFNDGAKRVSGGIILEDFVGKPMPMESNIKSTEIKSGSGSDDVGSINTLDKVAKGIILEDFSPKVVLVGIERSTKGIILEDYVSKVPKESITSAYVGLENIVEEDDIWGSLGDFVEDNGDESNSPDKSDEKDVNSLVDSVSLNSDESDSTSEYKGSDNAVDYDSNNIDRKELNQGVNNVKQSSKVIDINTRMGITNPTSDKLVKVVNDDGKSELKKIPHDIREFLKLYPNSEVSEVLKYYPKKELLKQLKLGRVIKVKNKLSI